MVPGEKTTEFWLTLVVVVTGAVISGYGLYKDALDFVKEGALLLVCGQGAYAGSRGLAKFRAAKPEGE